MSLIAKKIRLILVSMLAVLLTHCTKVGTDNSMQVNQKLVSPYTMPAEAYLALANHQTGNEKQSLMIMAAGRFIYDGQWQQGLNVLSQTHDLPLSLQNEKSLLMAKTDIIREQPKAALAKLASISEVNSLPIYYQVQYHELLAYSYHLLGHAEESVNERIQLEQLLPDDASKTNNRRALWLSLTTLPIAELNALTVEAEEGSIVQGWMKLALIAKQRYRNPDDMLRQLENWQANFSQHPARFILPASFHSIRTELVAPPKQIALLLPLSGQLSGPGHAIQDGFLAAYRANRNPDSVSIRFYDTNTAPITELYHRAIQEGANYVVGPLSKPDVATIAGISHPVPTLLLNDVDVRTTQQAYQFGLSPSHEARQVAARARKNGYGRALIIAPAGTWGDEVIGAFASQWQASGGHVVESLRYDQQTNLNTSIREFLHFTETEAPGKPVRRGSGHKVDTVLSRRTDFDVIFLLAYPSAARQIMPLLRYYYAGDVPVYATSVTYGGSANTRKDRDLDGIIFCDMPWVFTHQAGEHNWPEQFNSYNRLYALGMDSFDLSNQLNQLLLFPALGIRNNSGVLYLSNNQHISRILVFGQFKRGLAVMYPEGRSDGDG